MDAAAALFVQPEQMSRVGSSVVITRSADKGQKSQQQQQQKQQAPESKANANTNDINAIIAQVKNEFTNYRFTVYRCASKFVKLQKILHTSKIPYQLVLAILERHGMNACMEQDKLMVPPFQFTALLHDIYYACEKLGYFNESQGFQLEKSTALLANLFWNIFDPHRRHSISLLEIKLTFLLLCKLFNNDTLVSEFFNLVANVKTKCVSKFNFEYLVNILIKVLTYIGEEKSYGHHNLQIVMEQCFARFNNTSGLTEYQFHCLWNSAQTRLLIYTNLLALIKRIEETEHLIHNNTCAGCHKASIIGIRFKCQNCSDLSLCLSCFAGGYSSNKHVPTHRLLEIYTEDQPRKKWTHYLARLCCFHRYGLKSQQQQEEMKSFCNPQCTDVSAGDSGCNPKNETHIVALSNASIKQKNSRRNTYIVADSSLAPSGASEATQIRRESAVNHHDLSASLAGLTSTATNASERLQCIIDRLLLQNVKLEMQLSNVATASHDEISTFLSTHHMFLVQIIHEMRSLSNCSVTSTILTASTPRNSNQYHINQRQPSDMLYDPSGGGERLSHSINGADLNRSYLEANKSDFSFKDLSLWFDPKNSNSTTRIQARASFPFSAQVLRRPMPENILANTNDDLGDVDGRDTEMLNFKLLLYKVKEIVEDSYSDNTELSTATQNLEYMLDSMIKDEEVRRRST